MKDEKKFNLLLVEDDKLTSEILNKLIRTNTNVDEVEVKTVRDVENVSEEIKNSNVKPHFVILSEPTHGKIKFADEVPARIKQIKKLSPESEVLVLANPNKVERVIETFRSGAYDVVLKDEQVTKNVLNSIHRYLTDREEKSVVNKQREMETVH